MQWALFIAMGVHPKDDPDHVYTVEEFLPEQFRPPRRRQTWQEQLTVMQRFTAQMAEARENKTG